MHVALRDHRFWYEVEGREGSPVLLIMGFGMSGRAWAPQVKAMRARHQVLVYDNRGIGESESSKTPYDFGDLGDDAAALLDHVGFADAHVVGVSMGGMIAQHFALRHPRRVRSLTLIATHPGGPLRHTVPWPRGLGLFLRANTSRGAKRIAALRRLLYTDGHLEGVDPTADFDGDAMERFAVPADTTTRVNQINAILRHDVTRSLSQLQAPTLVVRPDADVLVRPTNSDRIHALIPGSRLVRFAAGHGVTHECAAALNATLSEHFAHADQRHGAISSAVVSSA